MDTVDIFWSNVKKLIKEQNTTQEWVANSSGISFRTFQNWMTRKRLPDADEAFKIASALNTTVEFLVTGAEPSTPDSVRLGNVKKLLEDALRAAND